LRKWKPVEVDVFVNDNMIVITLFIYSLLYFLFYFRVNCSIICEELELVLPVFLDD